MVYVWFMYGLSHNRIKTVKKKSAEGKIYFCFFFDKIILKMYFSKNRMLK